MTVSIGIIQIDEDELLGAPVPDKLATGKRILVFNFKINPKTSALKTGNNFEYAGKIYEVMNNYRVQAPTDYFKFVCFDKAAEMSPA